MNRTKPAIVFNVNDIIPYDEFISKCKSSAKIGRAYYIIITIKNVKYTCHITIEANTFNIEFLCNRIEDAFLIISNFSGEIGSEITTRIPFKTIGSYSPLETIMYITTFFYRMIGITENNILDDANGMCDNKPRTKYNLLAYRIFASNSDGSPTYPLDKLSIYYRFFKGHTMDFLQGLQERVDAIRELTYDFNGENKKITDVFRTFKKNSPDCEKNFFKLNAIHRELRSTDENYEDIFHILSHFKVNNRDSIYYPKPRSRKTAKSSTRKTMKHSKGAADI